MNIQKFTVSRKFSSAETFYNFEEFKNKMQLVGHVSHVMTDEEKAEVIIYFFKKDSKHIKSTTEFNKLLDRYHEPTHLIMITKEKFSIYLIKAMRKYPHLQIDRYLHKHFIIELNRGPLCSKHSILGIEEARRVCFELMAHGHKLPSISIDDPQNIWIGGKVNNIIKIESNSDITGKSIRYRIVTPISGKIEQSSDIKKAEIPKTGPEEAAAPIEEDFVDDYEE